MRTISRVVQSNSQPHNRNHSMFNDPFSEAKAAHAAAYLLKKGGGSLELLKLMKLMYLAERGFYTRYGRPMIGDQPYADRHGPVLESVYRAAANANDAGPTWNELILPRQDNDIDLRDPAAPLRKLSQADRNVLDAVWDEHGTKTGSQLRKWTHRNCKEYDELSFTEWDPRHPIDLHRLLDEVGFSASEADEVIKQKQVSERLDQQLLKAA